MKWYIGQPIVAIENSPNNEIIKGKEYIIKGLGIECSCGVITIDVGISMCNNTSTAICVCGKRNPNKIQGFAETRFAPLDVNISELTNILSEPLTINQ